MKGKTLVAVYYSFESEAFARKPPTRHVKYFTLMRQQQRRIQAEIKRFFTFYHFLLAILFPLLILRFSGFNGTGNHHLVRTLCPIHVHRLPKFLLAHFMSPRKKLTKKCQSCVHRLSKNDLRLSFFPLFQNSYDLLLHFTEFATLN